MHCTGPRPSQSTEQQEDALLTAFNAARSDSSYSISAVTCLRDLLGKNECILCCTLFTFVCLQHCVMPVSIMLSTTKYGSTQVCVLIYMFVPFYCRYHTEHH